MSDFANSIPHLMLAALLCNPTPITGQNPTTPDPAPPAPSADGSSSRELVPTPYALGAEYEYQWLLQGKPFATTRLRFTPGESDAAEGAPRSLQLTATLDYDRDGRTLSAETRLHFLEGALPRPSRYERTAEETSLRGGDVNERTLATFEGRSATITTDDGSGELTRTVETLPDPIRILDRDAPEHWVLWAPYLPLLASGAEVSFYAPTTRSAAGYRVRFDREERDGDEPRRRWTVTGPALSAKLWTDARGELLEYRQEQIQILRVAVRPPSAESKGEEATTPSTGEAGSPPPPANPPAGGEAQSSSSSRTV